MHAALESTPQTQWGLTRRIPGFSLASEVPALQLQVQARISDVKEIWRVIMHRAVFFIIALMALPVNADQMTVPKSHLEIGIGFVPVVKKAAPAVVNIYARQLVNQRVNPFFGSDFFDEMFGGLGTQRQRIHNSLGSGVIVSEDGILVSNYHVIEGAIDIHVVLNDRREFKAEILLADEESDLAVLRLNNADKMPTIELRNSDTVQVGELVLAIGNPFGVGQTVTSGIVSGLARSGAAAGIAQGYFIQTDAPINPGNSGGALVDANGRLIGINTRILSSSGGSIGIGFAIPSVLVRQFIKQARSGNVRFERPWAGMSGEAITMQIAESMNLDGPGGIRIKELHPDSVFKAAGFEQNDIITHVGDQPVNTMDEMIFRMSVAGLGELTDVTRVHSGKTDVVSVHLKPPPNEPPRNRLQTGRRSVFPGMTISAINPQTILEYGLGLSACGAVVENPGQTGERAGLRAGDVFTEINGKKVKDSEEARKLLRKDGKWLRLGILRGDKRLELTLRL